jgi:hypothetical protein
MNQRWHDPNDFLPAVDVRSLLKGLDDTNFSTAKLVERVASMRGLPIVLLACPIPEPKCYGWWLTSPLCDFIVYESNTPPHHQNHIICHELAHILLGHKTASLDRDSARQLLERCYPLTLLASDRCKVYAGSALSLQDTLGSNDVLMREMLDVHGALREAEAEALATLLYRKRAQIAFLDEAHPWVW